LVGEWRSSGERKYYLSNLSADTPLRALAATIKGRWICEQAHQRDTSKYPLLSGLPAQDRRRRL
jgi:hypothetical protein